LTWINQLDIIGVDAHYPLTNKQFPTEQDLVDGWYSVVTHLKNVSQFWNKSIIFTEIGYRSINGSCINPDDSSVPGTLNLTQQAMAYESVFVSLINESWWEGIHWWYWDLNPKAGGETDTDYVPQGKQETLNVLQQYYGLL